MVSLANPAILQNVLDAKREGLANCSCILAHLRCPLHAGERYHQARRRSNQPVGSQLCLPSWENGVYAAHSVTAVVHLGRGCPATLAVAGASSILHSGARDGIHGSATNTHQRWNVASRAEGMQWTATLSMCLWRTVERSSVAPILNITRIG